MKSIKSTIIKIKGDASFRSFYRKKNNKENSIIVYAKKEKEKNLLIYAAINSLLIKNKIDLFFEYGEDMNKRFLSIKGLSNENLNEIS